MKHFAGEERGLQRARELPIWIGGVQTHAVDFSTVCEFSLMNVGAELDQDRDL